MWVRFLLGAQNDTSLAESAEAPRGARGGFVHLRTLDVRGDAPRDALVTSRVHLTTISFAF